MHLKLPNLNSHRQRKTAEQIRPHCDIFYFLLPCSKQLTDTADLTR